MYENEDIETIQQIKDIEGLNIEETLNKTAKRIPNTHTRDFLIHNFNDICLLIHDRSIQYIRLYCEIFRIGTLQMTHFNNKPIDNRNIIQIEYQLKYIYAGKYKCVIEYLRNALDENKKTDVFETLFNVRRNDRDEYAKLLRQGHNDDIDRNVAHQLMNMRTVANEEATRKNHVLHLEPITLKLYEKSIKRLIRKHLANVTDMSFVITEHALITHTVLGPPSTKPSTIRTLWSALNHYMRFFPNDSEKQQAKEHYRIVFSEWLANETLESFMEKYVDRVDQRNKELVFLGNAHKTPNYITQNIRSVNKIKQIWCALKHYFITLLIKHENDVQEHDRIKQISETYKNHFTLYFQNQRRRQSQRDNSGGNGGTPQQSQQSNGGGGTPQQQSQRSNGGSGGTPQQSQQRSSNGGSGGTPQQSQRSNGGSGGTPQQSQQSGPHST